MQWLDFYHAFPEEALEAWEAAWAAMRRHGEYVRGSRI